MISVRWPDRPRTPRPAPPAPTWPPSRGTKSLSMGDQRNRKTTRITGTHVFMPVDEAAFVSTNSAAHYGLAAIQRLGPIAEHRPADGGHHPWSRLHDVPS